MILNLTDKLKKGLIVSCQADEGDPFNDVESLVKFAKAAYMGGAAAIRSEGIIKTQAIIENVNLPVIGLVKSKFEDGTVKITGAENQVSDLMKIGVHIIAVDGTFRKREGLTGPDFIKMLKTKFNCVILADIASLEEGIACVLAGADFVSSTLNGYTPETFDDNDGEPNFELVKDLLKNVNVPVFAEGRIWNPQQAKKMLDMGAHSVIVGTAITRPRNITESFIKALK
jgi:N-acylglucosamine-6-phosphate 2-epimerase